MTINLNAMQLTRPAQEHGSLAAARVPFIQQGDAAGLAAAAQQLGFQQVAPSQFQHADGSWVMLNGGRLERGYQGVHFRGLPQDITQFPTAAQGAFGPVAAVRINPGAGAQTAIAEATRQGFAQVLPNYYASPDGSWMAVVNNAVVRGFGQQLLHANDYVPPPGQQPAPPPTTTTQAGGQQGQAPAAPSITADTVLSYGRATPQLHDGFLAAAQLPFLRDLNSGRQAALQAGFAEKAPGYFEHKDGSWVSFTSQGRFERGHGQTTFQGVPVGPHRMSPVNPGMNHMGLAIAGLQGKDVVADPKLLTDAGFQKVNEGFYQHADGSFVGLVGGQAHFGHGGQLFTGIPSIANLPTMQADLAAVQNSVALWGMPGDPAQAKAFLAQKGFQETRPGFFQQGQVFVAIENGQLHAGVGGQRYSAVPTPQLLPQIQSNVSHSWLTIARTASLAADDPNLAQTLGGLGFQAVVQGQLYSHQDGSWIAVSNGALVRGHHGNVFSDVPQPPKPGQFQQFTQIPGGSWHEWAQRFAVAKIPVFQGQFTAAEVQKVMTHLGFVETTSGVWSHPDGSEVTLYNNRFSSCRFQQWDFGQFPYNRDDGVRNWGTMTTETQQWLNWARGQGTPPWPPFAGP